MIIGVREKTLPDSLGLKEHSYDDVIDPKVVSVNTAVGL